MRQLHEKPHLGIAPLGYLDDGCTPGEERAGVRVLGKLSDVTEFVAKHQPDRIVVGIAERRNVLPMNALLDLRFGGVRIEEAAALYENVTGGSASRNSGRRS